MLKILVSLNNAYKDLCSTVHERETSVMFDKLNEKLMNHEAHIKSEAQKKQSLPNMCASTNPNKKSNLSSFKHNYQQYLNQPFLYNQNHHFF